MTSEPVRVHIERLGAEGDGIAVRNGQQFFVPGALPGEDASVCLDGTKVTSLEILTASPERTTPICKHFARCGGCRTQHMSPNLNRQWKRDIVVQAFAHRGLSPVVDPVASVPLASRRRAVLAARKISTGILLGYREEASHTIVDLAKCPVLSPAIVAALPGLRSIADILLDAGEATRLQITKASNGLDVAASKAGRKLSSVEFGKLAECANRIPLLRLRVGKELVYQQDVPFIKFANSLVELTPDMFIQAVPEAEHALVEHVTRAVEGARSLADLFCGAGTFTLPLARNARIRAVDSDAKAIAALTMATKATPGLKPVETLTRDLFREPLSRIELADIDAAVIDPPRAGAEAQTEMLARSTVPLIVMVSCNPATLARDARVLVDAGLAIERVSPVDQFAYSPHVEAVAVLRRPRQTKSFRRRPM